MNKTLKFPSNFTFAVADADLQVVGEDFTIKEEGSEPTMWKDFAQELGKVYKNTPPGVAVDRYHKWPQDIEIMKELGISEYRTSVSMARTLKKDGSVNEKAIKWYRDYFKSLNKAGIKVYATLYHWELPLYLHEIGGWKHARTIKVFEEHAHTVARELGDLIEEYFILNEPWCSSLLSYYHGIHAPGETDLKGALQASHNLLLAQGKAFRAIKSIHKSAKISTVFNIEPAFAKTGDKKDLDAARYYNGYFNWWFLDPVYLGRYPDYMLDLYGKKAPKFTDEEMSIIKIGPDMHSLGINYYLGRIVEYDEINELKFRCVDLKGSERNDLGWVIFVPPKYPKAFTNILSDIYHSYKHFGLKKIYITENGLALKTPWDKKSRSVSDDRRISYYKRHISQVYDAIVKGVPVEKYFLWTLMDNYEWAQGFRPKSCFGIIHVDRKTLKRVWKMSARWYRRLVKSKKL